MVTVNLNNKKKKTSVTAGLLEASVSLSWVLHPEDLKRSKKSSMASRQILMLPFLFFGT